MSTVKFKYHRGVFYARCSFEDRHVLRKAGFRFNADKKVFYTPSYTVAARLRSSMDASTKKEIDRKIIHFEPWAGPLLFPPNEAPKHYQPDAALFALSRSRSYLALDPGLGKTPIAVMVANALAETKPHLFIYVCPPFLTRNVQEEFKRWKTFESNIRRYNSEDALNADVLIIPDSLLHRPADKDEINWYIEGACQEGKEITFFVDEAHRFKNPEAERTRALFGWDKPSLRKIGNFQFNRVHGLLDRADRIVYMSGTPVPNRLMELYPVLSHSAPETIDFMNRFEYGMKFCEGHYSGFGYDFNGGTKAHARELAKRIYDKFMLRLKKSVLKDLPAKLEEMLILEDDMPPMLADLDRSILSKLSPGDDEMALVMHELAQARGELNDGDEMHLATYRRLLGIAKTTSAVKIAAATLEETGEPLIIFAHHKEVIERLAAGLKKFNPLVITGKTPMEERHNIVNAFQKDETRRLIIANYLAAGVGLTLTKARRVDFVEWDWVPGVNDQASDRAHRIGQTADVYVRYLVFANSLDKWILETNLRKREVIKQL